MRRILVLLCTLLFCEQAGAQTYPVNTELGALITNSSRAAGTVTSGAAINVNWRGAICTLYQTAHTGAPAITFTIDTYDGASRSWNTIATSVVGAVADNTPYVIEVYPGGDINIPSQYVYAAVPLPRQWRVSQTISGSGPPTSTGTIGCNQLN